MEALYYKSQRELERFRSIVRDDYEETKIDFKHFRYPEEANYDQEKHEKELKQRVVWIEKTIDRHLEILHGKSRMPHFQYLEYSDKLQYLFKLQNQVCQHQKGEERLRMEGITQSYNVYDSVAFKSIKAVRNLLKDTDFKYSLQDEDQTQILIWLTI